MNLPPLFLYLNEDWHADAWINGGGPVPINPASKFLGPRTGTSTPDEVIKRDIWGLRGEAAYTAEEMAKEMGCEELMFENCDFVGPGNTKTSVSAGGLRYNEVDSLIVCLSKTLSAAQAKRLSEGCAPKKAVVRIKDPSRLMADIGMQLGVQGTMGHVRYTRSQDRDAFIKYVSDRWQTEYRLSFPISDGKPRNVTLTPGNAELVDMSAASEIQGSWDWHVSRDELMQHMSMRQVHGRWEWAYPPHPGLPGRSLHPPQDLQEAPTTRQQRRFQERKARREA